MVVLKLYTKLQIYRKVKLCPFYQIALTVEDILTEQLPTKAIQAVDVNWYTERDLSLLVVICFFFLKNKTKKAMFCVQWRNEYRKKTSPRICHGLQKETCFQFKTF